MNRRNFLTVLTGSVVARPVTPTPALSPAPQTVEEHFNSYNPFIGKCECMIGEDTDMVVAPDGVNVCFECFCS